MNIQGSGQRVELVVFDLDGTLVDSRVDICASIQKTLAFNGMDPVDDGIIASMIGTPLRAMFSQLLNTNSPEEIEQACVFYRNWFFDHCADESRLFDGVLSCLDALKPLKLAVGTGKLRFQAIKVLDEMGITDRFCEIVGSDGLPCKPDPATPRVILQRLHIMPQHAWMVGDTTLDILAGKAAGMRTCAVTTGTDSHAALEASAPDILLHTLADLPRMLGIPNPASGEMARE